MMIASIQLKNVASFGDNDVQIDNLNRINFIYGANGTGKTTISNLVANPLNSEFRDCKIKWHHDLSLKCLVYNKQFRDNNFGSKGSIDGVFTLGQATKEELEAINLKTEKMSKLKEGGVKKKETLEKQESKKKNEDEEFKEALWKNIYKRYEGAFRDAFKGFMQKELFKNKFLKEFDSNNSPLMTVDALKEKAKTIFGEEPVRIDFLKKIPYEKLSEIENNSLWAKQIIGRSDVDIAKMIQRLNLNDWVNQGKSYLQENENICPFCQQPTISEKFKKDLEDYFDESFTASIQQINSLSDEYNRLSQNFINELSQIESSEKINKETKLNLDTFSAYLKTLSSQFSSNKELIRNKTKEPSRSIGIVPTKEQLINIECLISEANKKIEEHNIIVANYQTQRSNLIISIWKYLVEEYKLEVAKFRQKAIGLQKGIDCLNTDLNTKRKEWSDLDSEIKELTKNITSVQPTIDQINNTLKYYGFLNFEIVPSKSNKNQYQIKRDDGTLAESTLSEGEITFITFLYYMQLSKGSTNKDTISDERVLVVDDPISSLDSNILFVVSTLIKKVIKGIKESNGNIKQLILLTHNVYFHKEVSFIDGRTQESRNTHYWILRKRDKESFLQDFKMKNPIQTSYELLWQELRDRARNSGITIQNTMRRIIENYFRILGRYGDDELIAKFDNCEEQEICRSLICWINDGSHCIADDLFIESQEGTIEKYMKVFEKIFERMDHKGHYDMMMSKPRLNGH
jgi:wobble nucleotide-excising tRNase